MLIPPIDLLKLSRPRQTKFPLPGLTAILCALAVCTPASAAIAVQVSPSLVFLSPGQTAKFTASVSGTPNLGVRWAATAGTIDNSGQYTAPATMPMTTNVIVLAFSLADQSKMVSALVMLKPASSGSLTVSPSSGSLKASQSMQLTATPVGLPGPVVWSMSPQVGTISTAGTTAVYNAPSSIDTQRSVEIAVRSTVDTAKVAKTVITLLPAVSMSLAPSTAEVAVGRTLQFAAGVTGASDTSVDWSLSAPVGTVNSGGLYTAPSSISASQEVTLTATSRADRSRKASARITVSRGGNLTYSISTRGLESLKYRGVEHNYKYGENLLSYVTLETAQGPLRGGASCAQTLYGSVVSMDCQASGRPLAVKITYTPCPNDGICAEAQITNRSTEKVSEAVFSTLGVTMSKYDAAASRGGSVGTGNPAGWVSFVDGKFGLWIDTPFPDTSVNIQCGWSYLCKNQMTIRDIPAGATVSRRYCLRFTSQAASAGPEFLPEAYRAYGEARPMSVNWPDRRPIMAWWLADTTKRSAVNPRGYLQDPLLNASNAPLFRDKTLAVARRIRDMMTARVVRPQGLILWDIEGQEFDHPTTYIGDPRVFESGYAPEMNSVIDEVFATFRDAGFKVGVTLRPQYLQWGKTLPATCTYDPYNGYKDYFVKVDNGFKQSMHACYDPNGRTWSVLPVGNGAQTEIRKGQYERVLDLLRSKAAYAKKRWGTTIFYVDSAVWTGGGPLEADMFKTLQKEFPDCLFIPEQETLDTFSATIPFTDVKVSTDAAFAPLTWRWTYPQGAMTVKWNDCTGVCWENMVEKFKIGQKVGDIALLSQPIQMSVVHLANVESVIQDVRREMSNVFVTDSSRNRRLSFTGKPNEILSYPVKMRVYFAPATTSLASSSTYCEAGQWLGENSCTLDLSKMRVSQVRYYDFAGKWVKDEAAAALQ